MFELTHYPGVLKFANACLRAVDCNFCSAVLIRHYFEVLAVTSPWEVESAQALEAV